MPIPSTQLSPGPETALSRPEHIPFRVLLAVPEALTIPIFALGVEARREPVEAEVIEDGEALSHLVGGNLSRTLVKGRYGDHRLVRTRFRLGRRTAVYSSWLGFSERSSADAFVADHPRFGLAAIEAATRAELAHLEAALRVDVVKGRYDLGPLDHRMRRARAEEYIELSDDLLRLSGDLSALKKLREGLAALLGGTSVG